MLPSQPPKSWSSVVSHGGNVPSFTLDYFTPDSPPSADGRVIIKPPSEVLKMGNNLWNSSLVGGVLEFPSAF